METILKFIKSAEVSWLKGYIEFLTFSFQALQFFKNVTLLIILWV